MYKRKIIHDHPVVLHDDQPTDYPNHESCDGGVYDHHTGICTKCPSGKLRMSGGGHTIDDCAPLGMNERFKKAAEECTDEIDCKVKRKVSEDPAMKAAIMGIAGLGALGIYIHHKTKERRNYEKQLKTNVTSHS